MVEKHVCVIPTITQAPPGNIWPQHHLYPVLIFLQAPLSMIPALRLFFPHVLVFTWSPIPLVFQKMGDAKFNDFRKSCSPFKLII
jgi:hypothetical protein